MIVCIAENKKEAKIMSRKKIGNYYVIKQIGEGGFAYTYLAEHCILKQPACIKQNIKLSEEDKKMLIKEAKLIWEIHHHSLPSIRDMIELEDGSLAMVMSYIPGKDLFKVKTEDYPDGIDPEHVCWMTQRALGALHYLHYYGIIHGDMKPQNQIVQPKNHNLVLVDYGLSTVFPGRYTECPGCTPAFAAPEQLEGKPPIPETDIYGLGATMIFALGGKIGALTIPATVPKILQNFFLQMVRNDPLKRPNDSVALAEELGNIRGKVFGRRSSKEELIIKE
jgi:eukaryotic-like serine/threonine-protein kinase